MYDQLKQVVQKQLLLKRIEQLEEIDGLIFPGGESTTMRRLD